MRSPLPPTPTLRYERMGLAALAALFFALPGLAFLLLAVQAAAQAGGLLQVWTLGSLGGALLALALAFGCFAVIKIEPAWKARHLGLFVRTRQLGMVLVGAAVLIGLSALLAHAIAG